MITGLCAKVTTMATIIAKDGRRFVGMNWCANPQPKCPRKSGEGYQKCLNVCRQVIHAEVMACYAARDAAFGGTLYLEGHTYACENCTQTAERYGIIEIVVGPPPKIEDAPPLSEGK